MIFRPLVGISMGDPFGNGPEISVKALNDKALYDRCRPLLVGDSSCMEYALKVAEKVSGIVLTFPCPAWILSEHLSWHRISLTGL